jgi:hypothetical protein
LTKWGVHLGENTPTVMPSSFTATPISAKTASRCILMASVRFSFSSHVSFSSGLNCRLREREGMA